MTYEKTLERVKSIVGPLERPEEMEKYVDTLLSIKGEVIDEILSRLNLPEEQKTYLNALLNSFYTSLISDRVEKFWRERYERSFENVRRDISAETYIIVASELASVLSRRILNVLEKGEAAKIIPYIVGTIVFSLAFVFSAREDMERDFLGVSADLMERIRKLGAGKGK